MDVEKKDYVPSVIMRYFTWDHLPPDLGDVSEPFCRLAIEVDRTLPAGAEKAVALRRLLEAKDAAVRSVL